MVQVPGGQELGVKTIDRGGGFARPLQRDARFASDGIRGRVDVADAVEPRQRQ